MKFNQTKIESCCNDLKIFLGKVETFYSEWKDDEMPPIQISFNIISGYYQTGFEYCPFCGSKIELIEDF